MNLFRSLSFKIRGNKNFQPSLPLLKSLAGCLLIAIILSFVAVDDRANQLGVNLQVFSRWILHLIGGYLAHITVIGIFIYQGWLPKQKTIKGMFPCFFSGASLTCVLFIALNWEATPSIGGKIAILNKAYAISAIVQLLLYPTNIYNDTIEYQQEFRLRRGRKKADKEETKHLLIQIDKERVQQISMEDLSVVFVEDHYLSYIFRRGEAFEKITSYGKLKDLEAKLASSFLKINRSTLINPDFIKAIHQETGRAFIFMEGLEEKALVIPKTRMDLVASYVNSDRSAQPALPLGEGTAKQDLTKL